MADAVAVKAAPSVSVTNTPPAPALAPTVPAVVRIGVPAVPTPLVPAPGVASATAPAPALRRVVPVRVIDPPVALPPVPVPTVIVPPEPDVMFPSTAPPVPPPGAFTAIATALGEASVVAMVAAAACVKPVAPTPSVFALIAMGPEYVPPPRLALTVTPSPLASVIGPLPVVVAPPMVSVPARLVRPIGPAPAAVAVKLAPSVSVMKTPPDPAVPVTVAAVVRIGAPDVPIPLAPAAGVVRMTEPAPVARRLPVVWVIEPPVTLGPVFVATVIRPPEPVLMLPSAASPVPPAAALTFTRTAFVVVLVVETTAPAPWVKPSAPAPSVPWRGG